MSEADAAAPPRQRLHALLEGPGTLVVKVGSSSLATAEGIDGQAVDTLVDRLARDRNQPLRIMSVFFSRHSGSPPLGQRDPGVLSTSLAQTMTLAS